MKIHVRWLDRDHRVILQTFDPDWSWADFAEASRLEAKMMDTVDHQVDVVADGRSVQLPGRALSVMPEIRNSSATLNHPNGGNYILVGINRVVQTFVEVYTSVFKQHGTKVLFANTFEEAYEVLGLSPEDIEEPYE
ncbi:MAG: hypothetical protein JXJ17_14460 [Anaerolineae bacterium]|nr:hypothetical protein [Anaerolineae bacterium]